MELAAKVEQMRAKYPPTTDGLLSLPGTSLHNAAKAGDTEAIGVFLKLGHDIEARTPYVSVLFRLPLLPPSSPSIST